MAIAQKCCQQYWTSPRDSTPTKQQLNDHRPPITKTILVRLTRHAGHCWRSWDELISDIFLWTPSDGRAESGRPARTYIQQLCVDSGYSLEDLRKRWTLETDGDRSSRGSLLEAWHDDHYYLRCFWHNDLPDRFLLTLSYHIYQPLRSGRIWH